jgi:hypothetical protein
MDSIPDELKHLLEKRAATNRRTRERRKASSTGNVACERRKAERRQAVRRKKS